MSEQDPAGAAGPDPSDPSASERGGAGDEPAPTGVPAADEAKDRLADIDDAPLEEHVEVYEDVHRRLQEGLADLDER